MHYRGKFKIVAIEKHLKIEFKLIFQAVVECRQSMGKKQYNPLKEMVNKINGI